MKIVIKKYNGYLYEGVKVKELSMIYSDSLIKMLNNVDSIISKELLDILKSDQKYNFSFVDLTDNIEQLSRLTSNRIERIEGITDKDLENPKKDSPLWGGIRERIRLGAFVTRLLPKYTGTKELENFVQLFKSKLDVQNYEIKMVRGNEIKKWYHINTYYNAHPEMINKPPEGVADIRSTLMKSCLKEPEKQTFFEIYCQNPEQVGMLIMLNKNKKLVARAIIWLDVFIADIANKPTKGVLMDRIYYTNESDVHIFIDYAKEHGWWYKPSQAKDIDSYVVDGVASNKTIRTTLIHHGDFERYPYMDTMCYYTPFTGRLSSNRGKPAKIPVGMLGAGDIIERYQLRSARGRAVKLAHDR